jgi:hypothetical protein
MTMPSPNLVALADSRRRLAPPPAVCLWRPDIVLATSVTAAPARRQVVVAEPAARPAALGAQLDTARSVLISLAGARHALGAAPVEAGQRAATAESTRERVSATIAVYRAEAVLDDLLLGAWRRMSALMEARGLR